MLILKIFAVTVGGKPFDRTIETGCYCGTIQYRLLSRVVEGLAR